MKKFILAALAVCLYLLCALTPTAHAPVRAEAEEAGGYACVLDDDTFFYAAKDEKQGLFLLPKTYFVKVLEAAPDYTKIEYLYDGANAKKLTGYAKTAELTFVDYTPTTPYLSLQFDVRYTLADDTAEGSSFLNGLTVTCSYYGDYKIGSKTYCYVLRGDEFGYILKPADLAYEENPEYAERLKQAQGEEKTTDGKTEETDGGKTSPAQIAILIALCLLVPLLAALILRSPKKPPYEEE